MSFWKKNKGEEDHSHKHEHHHHHDHLAKTISVTISTNANQQITFSMGNISIALDTTEQNTITVAGQNAVGGAAPLTAVAFAVDNSAIATVTPDATGLIGTVVALTAGTCNITVTASDANGTALAPVTVAVTVTAALAVSFTVTAGTPTAQAPPAAPAA